MEYIISLLYLINFFTIGFVFIHIFKLEEYLKVSATIGMAIVTLLYSFLYFTFNIEISFLKLFNILIFIFSILFILRNKLYSKALSLMTPYFLVFILLIIPILIGGEQYYVFRGNHWDHFNYIDMALTIRNYSYNQILQSSITDFLSKDILMIGSTLLKTDRPSISLIFSVMLPSSLGDIHLFSVLFTILLWTLIYPVFNYTLENLFQLKYLARKTKIIKILIVSSFVFGFYCQYIFDINAWSQLSTVSILLLSTNVLFNFQNNPDDIKSKKKVHSSLLIILFSSSMILYPENAIIHIILLIICELLLSYFIFKKKQIKEFSSLIIVSSFSLVIWLLQNWQLNTSFILKQVKFSFSRINWWDYFGKYLFDINLWAKNTPFSLIKFFGNLVNSLFGLYFLTPVENNHSIFSLLAYVLFIFTFSMLIFSILRIITNIREQVRTGQIRQIYIILLVFCYALIGSIYVLNKSYWSALKLISYSFPYLYLFILIGFFNTEISYFNFMKYRNIPIGKVLVSILVIGNLSFGLNRVLSSYGNFGIGVIDSIYPSIQMTQMKTEYIYNLKNLEYDDYTKISITNFESDKYSLPSKFYLRYIKEKLVYKNIDYYTKDPVFYPFETEFIAGFQKEFEVDANMLITKNNMQIYDISIEITK